VNTCTEKLPEEQDQLLERAAKALELCIKKEPNNYVAQSHLMIFTSQKPGISRKERKALEEEALSILELTVKKDLAYYVARSYLVALMIRDAKLTQAKEEGWKICNELYPDTYPRHLSHELCDEHLVASLSRLGNGARLPIFGLFFQLAEAFKINGERTQAIIFAQKAANLFPTYPNPHMMLGELLHAIGAYAESAQECKLALMHHANSSSPAIRHPLMCHAYWTLMPQDYSLHWSIKHSLYSHYCTLTSSCQHLLKFDNFAAKFEDLHKRPITWTEIDSWMQDRLQEYDSKVRSEPSLKITSL